MWDGAYFNRNPPVTHKRTNISSQWFIAARLHDTSVQWCRACLLKNKQRKGKRCYFTARASGLCYDCGSTNPHTLILCTTLPVRKDNCNCKTHHSHEVWAGNTEDYTFVHSSAIYTNTAWMCNTLQQAVRAVSPASPAKTADALMQKNTAALMAKQEDGSVSQKTKFNAFTPQQHHCSARARQTPAPWSCNWMGPCWSFHLFWWSCRVTVKIHLIIFKFMRFLSH